MTALGWIEADWDPSARLLTTAESAEAVGRKPRNIRDWAAYGLLTPKDWQPPANGRGKPQPLYLEADVLAAELAARTSRRRSGETRRYRHRNVAKHRDGTSSCDQAGRRPPTMDTPGAGSDSPPTPDPPGTAVERPPSG